ncbi:ATP-dependent RNA helicase dbp6 [Entomortierella beljakovae]|nr:ATP-dependent RNA helicase dbp6 [Entomortierella beljakovae]
MFNIKRYDVDTDSSTPNSNPVQDRLAKLNARLKKNKGTSKQESGGTTTTATSNNNNNNNNTATTSGNVKPTGSYIRFDDKDQSSTSTSKSSKTDEISYKRNRELEDERQSKKHGKKWEKKAKELNDRDLIPNDVRLPMKAEAEAAEAIERGIIQPIVTPSLPSPAPTSDKPTRKIQDKESDDDNNDDDDDVGSDGDSDNEAMDDQTPSGIEDIGGVEQFMDDAAAEAALADLESSFSALVPLPSFEVKEISATERERAKSMGIPDWLAHPHKIDPDTNTAIDTPMFGFSPRLIKQCKKAGIEECFAVQTAVIPVLMRARHLGDIRKAPGDLCVSAPTGSGKTLAYVLPIIEILSQRVVTRLRALVVLPTRDLCIQVKETFEMFVKGTDLKIATTTGQNSFAHEQSVLVGDVHGNSTTASQDGIGGTFSSKKLGGNSRVDILITTPGRLIDHIKSTPNFTLQHLRFLVIDEADRLLNQSFQDWLYHILKAIHPSPENPLSLTDGSNAIQLKMDPYGFPIHDAIAPGFLPSFYRLPESDVEDPKALSVQKLLFSATLTRNPAKIASLQLSDPQYVAVQETNPDGDEKQKYSTPAGLTEHMIVCDTSEKPLMVLHLLHHKNVRSALCFTKSVESAHRLYKLIQLYEKIRTSTPQQQKSELKQASKKPTTSHKDNKNKQDADGNQSDSGNDTDGSDDDDNNSGSDSEGHEDDNDDDIEMEDTEQAAKAANSSETAMELDTLETNPSDPIVVAEYSSDLPNSKRQSILRAFNKGEIHLLICSDLISRGMDLSPVSYVINYDVPVYMKKYIHRVGRTARAGKTGTAYSLVEMQEARHFKEMISKAGHWDKISRVKVKDQETRDLVPNYTKALAGLKDALVSSTRQSKKNKIGRRLQK